MGDRKSYAKYRHLHEKKNSPNWLKTNEIAHEICDIVAKKCVARLPLKEAYGNIIRRYTGIVLKKVK